MSYYSLSDKECNILIETACKLDNWDVRKSHRAFYSLSLFDASDSIQEKIKLYCNDILGITIETVKVGVIRYTKGGFFSKHLDIDSSSDFNKDFVYNINCILNTDFTGGDFYLEDELLKKNKGVIYHYSSDRFHEVKPIDSGVRYVGLFYIRKREIINKTALLI